MSATPSAPALFRYRFGQVEFDESDASLKLHGEPVAVERRPLELLAALLRQPGAVLTKAELLAELWQRDEATVSDNALANAVSKLRRALGPETGERLRNVPGVGYLLEGPIERIALVHKSALNLSSRPAIRWPHTLLVVWSANWPRMRAMWFGWRGNKKRRIFAGYSNIAALARAWRA